MKNGYTLLTEKEEMWARVLVEVLEDHDIPCVLVPVHGAGFALKTGLQDSVRIFVSEDKLSRAQDLAQELFLSEFIADGMSC